MIKKVGLIGSSGRKDDAARLNLDIYQKMLSAAKIVLKAEKTNRAVSGGAAWSDATAVTLFLDGDIKDLTLHLPAEFDMKNRRFVDTGSFNYITNPGGTVNYYHKNFSRTIGRNSLVEIFEAIEKGANIFVTPGLKERNTKIAEDSDVLLAMTFGDKNIVKPGGTADTVSKFLKMGKSPVYHYNLNDFTLYGTGRTE